MSFLACVFADAPRFLVTIFVSIYIAFFVMPALLANPITPADIDQALGLPVGTMASGRASPGGGSSRARDGQWDHLFGWGANSAGRVFDQDVSAPDRATIHRTFGFANFFECFEGENRQDDRDGHQHGSVRRSGGGETYDPSCVPAFATLLRSCAQDQNRR